MTDPANKKGKWSRRLIIGFAAAALLMIVSILASVFGIDYLLDIWWFNSLGYEFYYWQRLLYRYAVFGLVSLFFFLIFFLNFWVASRFLKHSTVGEDNTDQSRRRRLFKKFQTGSMWVYAPLSLVLSIPIAMPLFGQWQEFLLYLFGRDMGIKDPFLGKDAAFYLFSFPIYTLIQNRLLLALLISAAALTVLYLLKNHLQQRPLLDLKRSARWHISLLAIAIFGIGIWGFMLQRYTLLYDTSHQAIFYGPGYVEMRVVLPLIWACMLSLVGTAVALVILIQTGKGVKTFAAITLIFVAMLALRYTDYLPQLVQTYVVKPNEIEKEGPYIAQHIQATLDAYQLTDIEVRDFSHQPFSSSGGSPQVDEVLRNIPVWDADTLKEVFQQLQELRPYYMFPQISVGRYEIDGKQQQVFLAAREIDFDNLPGGARNWINEHLTYSHGHGAVMTPASQVSGSHMSWYLKDIPPQSKYNISPKEPRIYYGMGAYHYSIVPNKSGEMDYPKGAKNVMTDYHGRGGVPVSSLFRKFLFAYHFKNKDIFFSTKVTEQSKLLFRRNILERIRYLVPYLQLDRTPYFVTTSKGIYWIVDAYTNSSNYPAAAPRKLGSHAINYIRDAVKIVVDAYNGSVDLYVYDETDPIIRAYEHIFPGLFKSKDQLPEDLRPHIRYPQDFFDIQMQIYAKYHQQDTQVFYQQEDLWTFTQALTGNDQDVLRPYYVTLDLIEPGRIDFVLLLPMSPKNLDNLRAMAVAGCDPGNYGKLIVYNFPKGKLVYGPAQIDALINQDPDIAQQFTLWDQAGSQVVRGKMIILPIGNSVLFIQPVYLKATSRVKIPELQRIIMSEGEVAVIDQSVQQAYDKLKRRVAGQMEPIEMEPIESSQIQEAEKKKTADKTKTPKDEEGAMHSESKEPSLPPSGDQSTVPVKPTPPLKVENNDKD